MQNWIRKWVVTSPCLVSWGRFVPALSPPSQLFTEPATVELYSNPSVFKGGPRQRTPHQGAGGRAEPLFQHDNVYAIGADSNRGKSLSMTATQPITREDARARLLAFEPGSISPSKLAREWGWSRAKVRRFIAACRAEGIIPFGSALYCYLMKASR